MTLSVDVSSFIYNNQVSIPFLVKKQWFMLQRKVLFDLYGGFLNDNDRFRIYLYLCKNYDVQQGLCIRSKQSINLKLGYSTINPLTGKLNNYVSVVDSALTDLETEHFIKRVGNSNRSSYRCKIFHAPDYSSVTKKFYSNAGIRFDPGQLKNHNHGYIMVPSEALADNRLSNTTRIRNVWNNRRLKVLLMLYAHCQIEYFGGIDHRIATIDSAGMLQLNEGFCFNMKGSQQEILTTVELLISKGEFVPVRCWFYKNVYYGDVGKCTAPVDSKEKIILRPKYLINHILDSDYMTQILGRMFL